MKLNEMKSLHSRKLYLRVYDEIKEYIEKNHLVPGDKLPPEMKMCEMLGVSRNVLREAIKALEITGTVKSTPGVGIVIQEFNTDFFLSNLIFSVGGEDGLTQQIEELRRVLEIGFSKSVFNSITESGMQNLHKQLMNMEALYEQIQESQSYVYGVRFAEADAAFHKTLYQNVDNKLLKSIIEFSWACDNYYNSKTTPQDIAITVDKHRRIYEGLKSRSYEAFHDAMEYHFSVRYLKP